MTSKIIQICLIDTNPQGMKGSMSRYADIVEHALNSIKCNELSLQVRRLHLSLPEHLLNYLPKRLQTWVNHCWIFLTYRLRMIGKKIDIVHLLDGSYAYIINNPSMPIVCTTHDIIPLMQMHNRFETSITNGLAKLLIEKAIKGLLSSQHIISVSAQTKTDLLTFTKINPNRISIVFNALHPTLFSIKNRQQTNKPFKKEKFILHIGNNGHYKNREGVIRVFSKIHAKMSINLVMAGPKPSTKLRHLVHHLKLKQAIKFITDPEDKQLIHLYQHAAVFLFPSIYEGFGWPPLEAMALNCPVVCSSAGSLPEIVGTAALIAPVDEESKLAVLCLSILNDPNLAESLIKQGDIRIKSFTAEKMGQQLLTIYRRILK